AALVKVAADIDLTPGLRVRALDQLVTLGDPRVPQLLTRVAEEQRMPEQSKLYAVDKLASLGRRVSSRLVYLAVTERCGFEVRLNATRHLAASQDSRAISLLAKLAVEPGHSAAQRERVVAVLSALGDPRGAELMAAQAVDVHADHQIRVLALELLAGLSRRGADL